MRHSKSIHVDTERMWVIIGDEGDPDVIPSDDFLLQCFIQSTENSPPAVRPIDANRPINEDTGGREDSSTMVDRIEPPHHGGKEGKWSIEFTARGAEVTGQAAFADGDDDPDLACDLIELPACKLHRQKSIPAFHIIQVTDEVRRLHIENGGDILRLCPSEFHSLYPFERAPIHSPLSTSSG